MSLSELLSFDDDIECTQRYSYEAIVQNFVAADGDDGGKNDGKGENCRNVGTLEEHLRVIAHLKWITVARDVDNDSFIHTLRGH